MSDSNPRSYNGVLLGIGPFLRHRANKSTAESSSTEESAPAVLAANPQPQQSPGKGAASAALEGSPAARPRTGAVDSRSVEAEKMIAGQIAELRENLGNVRLLEALLVKLGVELGTPLQQSDEDPQAPTISIPQSGPARSSSHSGGPQASTTSASQPTGGASGSANQDTSSANEQPAPWGVHKEYADCCKSERRKRDKAIRELDFFWELQSLDADAKLGILGEIRPTEALLYKGLGVHQKPSIDEFFSQHYYEKADRDCSSSFLTQLSWFSQLLAATGAVADSKSSDTMPIPVMELLSCDIENALQEETLDKIILHPAQRESIRLHDIRSGITALEEEQLERLTSETVLPATLRAWAKTHDNDAHHKLTKLATMMKLQKKKLRQLFEKVNIGLYAKLQRLPPREIPTLHDPKEIHIEMSFHGSDRPFEYTVEYPGQEFTYEDIMQGELAPTTRAARLKFQIAQLAPTTRAARLKFQIAQLKARCKKQEALISKFLLQIHKSAMKSTKGRLISKRNHTRAVNDYIHSHKAQAQDLHRALLQSARLKASIKILKFHVHSHAAPILGRIEWKGFKRPNPGLES
ncbi:hypothetical protein HDK90DRAFT_466924 [Phyllosticta capitalensis]|uniref:Uncharacterized protein n=1 Tax=Phyllosticta capitalensis TaxID=121624 RepID=A0ABR1YN39_9PEZI